MEPLMAIPVPYFIAGFLTTATQTLLTQSGMIDFLI